MIDLTTLDLPGDVVFGGWPNISGKTPAELLNLPSQLRYKSYKMSGTLHETRAKRAEAMRRYSAALFLLPGSGGPRRPEPFPPLSYRLSASPSSLPFSSSDSKPLPMPPLLRGHDTIALSLSASIIYIGLHNNVKGFPARNPNY